MVGFFSKPKFGQEDSLHGKKFGALWLLEIAEVGVIDDIQSSGQLRGVLEVALCLLTKLQESVMNLDVRKRVDLGQCIDAHLHQVMLTSDMREAINDPSDFMVASIRQRITSGLLFR